MYFVTHKDIWMPKGTFSSHDHFEEKNNKESIQQEI